MQNTILNITDYKEFLNKAVTKFNISINEARNKYGLFTYKQWDEILNP